MHESSVRSTVAGLAVRSLITVVVATAVTPLPWWVIVALQNPQDIPTPTWPGPGPGTGLVLCALVVGLTALPVVAAYGRPFASGWLGRPERHWIFGGVVAVSAVLVVWVVAMVLGPVTAVSSGRAATDGLLDTLAILVVAGMSGFPLWVLVLGSLIGPGTVALTPSPSEGARPVERV